MTDRERKMILLDYQTTEKFIDKLDNQLFTIKGWALFTGSGIIAYGVSQKNINILFANIVVVMAFCFLETIYKTFHETAIFRMRLLEKMIGNSINPRYKLPSEYLFGMGSAIEPPKLNSILRILVNPRRWHLIGFYLMIVLGSIAAAFCIHFAN